METAEQLLEKLNRQFLAGEPAAVLLRTLTALEYAIRHQPPVVRNIEPAPTSPEQGPPAFIEASSEPDPEPVIQILEVDEAEIEEELRALQEAAALRQIRQQHLRPDLTHIDEDGPIDQQQPSPVRHSPIGRPVSTSLPKDPIPVPVEQIPHIPPPQRTTELNEAMADRASSLNDRFRVSGTAEDRPKFLEPITDLRKAIGINDKFRFVNELFSGDAEAFSHALVIVNDAGSLVRARMKLEEMIREKGSWLPDHPALRELLQLLERRYA